jgi:hypothetical protein
VLHAYGELFLDPLARDLTNLATVLHVQLAAAQARQQEFTVLG